MGFPTTEQEKVINHTGKPMVVVAAPGTGKTRTIVTRMIKLLKEDPNRNVSFLTFTRSSRKDTDKKVKGEVDEAIFPPYLHTSYLCQKYCA
jgi:superfamily I DNA/RNA helicase